MSELHDVLELADRLLDEPNADPDDDLRMLARHLRRQFESHERYKQALQCANGLLIMNGIEPVKLSYSSFPTAAAEAPEARKESPLPTGAQPQAQLE